MSQQPTKYLRNEYVCRLERDYMRVEEQFNETARSAGLRTAEDMRGNAQIQILCAQLKHLGNEWKLAQDSWRESLADKDSVDEDVEKEVDEQTADIEEDGRLDDIDEYVGREDDIEEDEKQRDDIKENVEQADEVKVDEKHQDEKQKDEVKVDEKHQDDIWEDEPGASAYKYRHIVPHREFMKALKETGTLQWMEERWERKKREMDAEMDAHVDKLVKMMREKQQQAEDAKEGV